jgi:translation initiation factor 1
VTNRLERPVYQTGKGRLCPSCGFSQDDCHCSAAAEQPVPQRMTCVLRLEKKGRGGKSVSVVAGLPRNVAFLSALAAELKRGCGSGGTVADGAIEIQGDQRERLRVLLRAKGMVVKG